MKKRLSTKKIKVREDPNPPEPEPEDDENDDPDTLVEIIQWSVDNYYNLLPENDEKMLDVYTPAPFNDTRCYNKTEDESDHTICPVRLDAQFLDQQGYELYNSTILLSKDKYWYFTNETLPELKSFIQNVTMFTLTYFVRVTYPDTDTL